jgi:hypothetical protein
MIRHCDGIKCCRRNADESDGTIEKGFAHRRTVHDKKLCVAGNQGGATSCPPSSSESPSVPHVSASVKDTFISEAYHRPRVAP